MLYVLCGTQASGKTTLAKKMEKEQGCIRYTFDEYAGSNAPAESKQTFEKFCQDITKDLLKGKDVVCDSLFTNIKRRKLFLDKIPKGIPKKVIVLTTPFDECMKRNEKRETKVDPLMLHIIHKTFQPPTLDEGWDEIIEYTN